MGFLSQLTGHVLSVGHCDGQLVTGLIFWETEEAMLGGSSGEDGK